jgi:hypothetical protein
MAFDADTTITVISCRGDARASKDGSEVEVHDTTYHLVRMRGAAIIAKEELGTWEIGPEWGGFGELKGVLHAGPQSAVAVVTIGEYGGPDTGTARVVVYRPDGDHFTETYDYNQSVHRSGLTSTTVADDRAIVSECVASTQASPPGMCEQFVNQEPRSTVLRWTGSAIEESTSATPEP